MSCPICGRIKANSPHHIIPRSEGGGDNPENITNLCKKCHDEVEEDPRKWARFLRYYYARKELPRRQKKAVEVERSRPRATGPLTITMEGTSNWLASQLGVPGRTVRRILRMKYPRDRVGAWKRYGILSPEQQEAVAEIIKAYIPNKPLPGRYVDEDYPSLAKIVKSYSS